MNFSPWLKEEPQGIKGRVNETRHTMSLAGPLELERSLWTSGLGHYGLSLSHSVGFIFESAGVRTLESSTPSRVGLAFRGVLRNPHKGTFPREFKMIRSGLF